MIHMDIKKLGKINGIGHRFLRGRPGMHTNKGHGWEFLHVAVDDASRLAYTEILPSEGQADTTDFLNRSLSWFGRLDVKTTRVMTDNGSAYPLKAVCHSHLGCSSGRKRSLQIRLEVVYIFQSDLQAQDWPFCRHGRHLAFVKIDMKRERGKSAPGIAQAEYG